MSRLEGRVAIVTGGAQGLGAAFARGLAGAGARVAVCDVRDPAPLVAELGAAGARALGGIVDVTDAAAVGAFVERVQRELGGLHILVNNAAYQGSPTAKPLTEITADEWDRTMAVNIRGAFECVRAVLPAMRAQRYGKIVNLTSTLAFNASSGMLQYIASKGAVLAMTRALARELGPDGIAVNALAPGRTLSAAAIAKGDDGGRSVGLRAIIREEYPEDLVGALVFLASAESDFVTGQTIVVDGGSVLH